MVERKTWEEFCDSKLLWFMNRLLHVFGWAIVLECGEDGTITEVYPARVSFRGFTPILEDEGFIGLTKYLAKEAPNLLREVEQK